ncbi:MAG: hypothetical protein Ct9H90mP8_1040 [Pseudomonadota bacterium]|nr:MAG: hypothetical protein Ct9H90mP8_1040 [Pseudomonadota bacterium]
MCFYKSTIFPVVPDVSGIWLWNFQIPNNANLSEKKMFIREPLRIPSKNNRSLLQKVLFMLVFHSGKSLNFISGITPFQLQQFKGIREEVLDIRAFQESISKKSITAGGMSTIGIQLAF